MTKDDEIIMKPSLPKVGHGATGYDPTKLYLKIVSTKYFTTFYYVSLTHLFE